MLTGLFLMCRNTGEEGLEHKKTRTLDPGFLWLGGGLPQRLYQTADEHRAVDNAVMIGLNHH